MRNVLKQLVEDYPGAYYDQPGYPDYNDDEDGEAAQLEPSLPEIGLPNSVSADRTESDSIPEEPSGPCGKSEYATPIPPTPEREPDPPFLTSMLKGNVDEYLNPVDFCGFLAHLGYRRYLANGTCELVLPKGKILEKVDMLRAKQDVENMLKANELIQAVKDKVFRKTKEFFKIKNLTTLPEFEGKFLSDTATECYKLYLNVAVRITADGFQTIPYPKLDRYVWREDIIQRAFGFDPDWKEGIYYRFTKNQCTDPRRKGPDGQPLFDEARHTAYLCSIGYNLHGFKSRLQPCLTIYSDATEGDRERNGGSGKSLIIQLLAAMQSPSGAAGNRLVLETGENLKRDYQHNFDNVTRQTKVVVIDDLDTRRFRIEDVYSWVSVGMKLNKKGQESEFLSFEEAPKAVITSNNPVSGTRDSDLRRRMDVQLHRYYNASHKPVDDFGRGFFNEGFNARDWRQFDLFALNCVRLALLHEVATKGLPPYANNVLETSLELEIGDDLVEYLDHWVGGALVEKGEAKFDAKALKTNYEEEYGIKRKESSKKFNMRLKKYGELRKLEVSVKASSSIYWCTFIPIGAGHE
ncbi:MAG: hypothetical protein K0B87_01090 [Candidatus Syntrophosphaera sp.]|nr:hypothetical protein [Candidatus Syntrophosphaera sp.]